VEASTVTVERCVRAARRRHMYVNGDPVNLIDPSGHSPYSICTASADGDPQAIAACAGLQGDPNHHEPAGGGGGDPVAPSGNGTPTASTAPTSPVVTCGARNGVLQPCSTTPSYGLPLNSGISQNSAKDCSNYEYRGVSQCYLHDGVGCQEDPASPACHYVGPPPPAEPPKPGCDGGALFEGLDLGAEGIAWTGFGAGVVVIGVTTSETGVGVLAIPAGVAIVAGAGGGLGYASYYELSRSHCFG
jgi:hypothetical protein